MKLEQAFEVAAPVDRVWATLIDVEAVAPCLPGAEITGADGDGAYKGTFSVKLGPASAAYAGSLRLETVDGDTRTVVMRAEGSDKRGQGTAKATIESRVEDAGDATRVSVVTDFTITGRLARFGRGGLMEDIANRLLRDFASCLEARIGAGATEALLDRAAESAAAQPTAASPEETGTVTPRTRAGQRQDGSPGSPHAVGALPEADQGWFAFPRRHPRPDHPVVPAPAAAMSREPIVRTSGLAAERLRVSDVRCSREGSARVAFRYQTGA